MCNPSPERLPKQAAAEGDRLASPEFRELLEVEPDLLEYQETYRAEGRAEAAPRARRRASRPQRELLRDLASRKFGDAAVARVAELAAETGDAAGLGRIGRWLMDCATDAELVARLDAVVPSA